MSRFSNPFGPLRLSHDDEQQLDAIAKTFVRETLAQYQHHVVEAQGQVDATRWKFVKQRENVAVFQERPSKNGTGGAAAYKHMGGNAPWAAPPPAADLPILLGVGTIVGTLDDVMYGVVNATQDLMRLKTSYVNDNVVDAAVLATLIAPTVSEPFRALTVKWAVKGRPLHVRSIVKNRDVVYLESTGIATLADGERIGYQLLHSVAFPQVHSLASTVRGNMSLSGIYRQRPDATVELYMRGFLDPAGGLMRSIVVKSAAEAMVSVWKNVHCAQMKKLAWVLRRSKFIAPPPLHDQQQQQRQQRLSRQYHSTSSSDASRQCTTCHKKASALDLVTKRVSCAVCRQYVCVACRIKKKLSVIAPGGDRRLVHQRVAFCATCIRTALHTSALTVASDEILAHDDACSGIGTMRLSMHSVSSSSATSYSNSIDGSEYN